MEEFIKRILQKENIEFGKIEKSSSGFTNFVYFVDDKYVVKVANPSHNPSGLEKEIEIYNHIFLEEMPKYIASGVLDEKKYLIIEKLKGQSLYKIWHKLSDDDRRDVVKQIANILKKIHSQTYDFLPSKFVTENWQNRWRESFKKNIKILNEKGLDTECLERFRVEKLDELFKEQKICLIYNDAHFDNFIYDKKVLKIIDFDRARAFSKDYELLIIKQMIDNPIKFASEEDEPNVKDEDYSKIYDWLKQFYPEMFDFKGLDDRVFVYQFIYNLSQAYEYNKDEWAKREIEKFKQYFKF